MALLKYDWIFALITIAFCFSAFGNGANDVANSYATSVAARTLTMPQVGILSMCTEFVGAVALGSRVTSTIKNGIIDIKRFEGNPGALMLAMACAETGNAIWLMVCTRLGMPVSTTQTIVGALIGVGFASQAQITWGWKKGSVSQIAASWGVAPAIAASFSALIFLVLKYSVLERRDPFKWAMRLIPFYLSVTAALLALFIVIEAPTADSLEEFGPGKACGIILGVLFGMLIISYVFFMPYFKRRLVMNDSRVKFWHIPLGPLLLKEDPPLYFPGDENGPAVIDYYENSYYVEESPAPSPSSDLVLTDKEKGSHGDQIVNGDGQVHVLPSPYIAATGDLSEGGVTSTGASILENGQKNDIRRRRPISPEERFLSSTKGQPWYKPQRMMAYAKYGLLHGVTVECVSHDDEKLRERHSYAKRYDLKVEHLWTYAQVASAMMMSIAHGSNDVANAVGPWAATYETFQKAAVSTKAPTPVWMLVVAGFLLGCGFWFFGYHTVRALGNRITLLSPTRGFSMELGAAITVMLASRLSLPVSTTQCLTGSTIGVALCNYDLRAVNWKQVAYIFMGWMLTLPMAGLISGLLMVMALNAPHL